MPSPTRSPTTSKPTMMPTPSPPTRKPTLMPTPTISRSPTLNPSLSDGSCVWRHPATGQSAVYQHLDRWAHPSDPCTTLTCEAGDVEQIVISCPQIQCVNGSSPVAVEGGCCPRCPAPCDLVFCTQELIECASGASAVIPDGECCPRCPEAPTASPTPCLNHVQCLIAPCDVSANPCPGLDATCVNDYCGGCFAHWLLADGAAISFDINC